ncbi:maleylpyruvate isomerase family mycothiol-dependent enzyme [Kitasatospora sp. NPDC051170]|uniref:maleylpyruvate isomerase family mycothiol-dependent enzyme n=1 Tax=Kitasatospora sp. NPDC051170 TaxID=3364056 RepID=UPI0037A50DC0
MEFSDLVRLIEERAAVFCAVVEGAPDLGVQVPTCPEWTLFDLAQHIGQSRRFWAMNIAAGEAEAPSAEAFAVKQTEAPQDRAELVEWVAEGVRLMAAALREAGPESPSWAWWGDSQSPLTVGAVARHQLQEIAVHTYDAQLAVGAAEPLPLEVALDGVDEFLHTCCPTSVAWPFEPALLDYRVKEGGSWRLSLSGDGVRVSAIGSEPGDVTAVAGASELVLTLYGRLPVEDLEAEGDLKILRRIADWDPSA